MTLLNRCIESVVDDAVNTFSGVDDDASKLCRMGDEEGGFSFSAREDAVYMGSLPFFDRFLDGKDMVDLLVSGIKS